MGFLSNITNQLGVILQSQSTARRLMLLLVAVGSVAGLIFLAVRANTGGYQALPYPNLQATEVGEAMTKLRQVGIAAKLENGGATIMVPRNKVDDAVVMLAMEGIPGSGTVGFELMDKSSLGQSKFQQEKNYNRMREGELARTLMSIREIERARVSLALPEDSLFVQSEKQPTASVVLKLRHGAQLNDHQLSGIIHLVSHSVEGLKPENVSVVDSLGNLLNPSKPDGAVQASITQQNFKTNFEELLKSRIETMLEPVIGKGKVSARVQADFDFATSHQIMETYNPEEQDPIIKTQKTQSEMLATDAKSKVSGGATGSDANTVYKDSQTQAAQTGAGAAEPGTRKLDQTVDYVVSKKWEESQQTTPTPQRVSVAVLIDGLYEEATDAKGNKTQDYRERTPEELLKLEDLVKATIGFSEKRQDTVKVQCAQFKLDAPDEMKETWLNSYPVRQYLPLGIQWGIVALIGLLTIFLVLRPAMKQILVTPAPLTALPGNTGSGSGTGGQITAGEGVALAGPGNSMPGAIAMNPGDGSDMKRFESMMDELEEIEVPEELKGNQEAIRAYKLQRIAAQQAKFSQVQSERIHHEVLETAKSNPQKTVSLIRQWMEEA